MLWRKGSSGTKPQGVEAGAVEHGTASVASIGHVEASESKSDADAPANQEEHQKRRTAIVIRQSVAFAQLVSVLARSPMHKFFTLADLEWLVIPPLTTGQFAFAEAKAQVDGPAFPVAVVLWANVSSEVDKRLCDNLNAPIRLKPEEWHSGDILWLVDAAGDPRVLPGFLQRLGSTVWKDRAPKMRTKGGDGKWAVKQLTPDVLEHFRAATGKPSKPESHNS